MKAFVLRTYGSSGDFADLPEPAPGEGEVLVRVHATSVNPYDWHHLRGEPCLARLMPGGLGPRRPRYDILGCDMAGRVEATGKGVTEFRPGDEVFGLLPAGGFAEYVSVRADVLARKPGNLSFQQSAAMPMAAVTALAGLRDSGGIQPGQTVLVNGASGGVGTFAVQIAHALGAEVTGVCGPHNRELVRSIGAVEVIDYRREDFTRTGRRYDLVLDIAGSHRVSRLRKALSRTGTLVLVGGPAGRWVRPMGRMLSALATAPLVPQRVVLADAVACRDKKATLRALTELAEAGSLTPVIDRCYPFDEIRAAIDYQEQGHARGKVVVTLSDRTS